MLVLNIKMKGTDGERGIFLLDTSCISRTEVEDLECTSVCYSADYKETKDMLGF